MHPPGRSSSVRSPAGEMEIAGFEDNTSDGRPPSAVAAALQPARRRRRRRRSGAGCTRRGCRHSSGRPRTPTAIACSTTCSYRREGETGVEGAEARDVGSDLRVGHDVGAGRHLLSSKSRRRTRRRTRPATALVGDIESASFDIDNTRAADRGRSPRRAPARARRIVVHRAGRAVGGAARRVLARRQPLAHGLPEGRHPGFAARRVRGDASTTAKSGRSVIIRATDAMNNVATAVAEVKR